MGKSGGSASGKVGNLGQEGERSGVEGAASDGKFRGIEVVALGGWCAI